MFVLVAARTVSFRAAGLAGRTESINVIGGG